MEETKKYLKIGSLCIQKNKILFFHVQKGAIMLTLENYFRRIAIYETMDPLSHTKDEICVPYDTIIKLPVALFEALKIYLRTESQRLDGDKEEI
jgi:hypothetical protein